jgi:NADPH-dependent 2,4-dienoyl-CoA reductase/sulfur reductase-like enzyme
VVLLEQNPELGGNCLLGSKLPEKEKLEWVVEFQRERLKKMDVDLRLSTPFSVELFAEVRPDFLILAIGAEPCLPTGIEMNGSDPLHAENVIRNRMSWSKAQLVVIGAGALGCELALSLAQADNDVTILEVVDRPVRDVEPINRFDLLDRLDAEKRVRLITRFSIEKAGAHEVRGLDVEGGHRVIRADAVIWAAGYQPRQLESISGLGFPETRIRRIGDCLRPRNVYHAVNDGFWLGAKINRERAI